MKNKISFSYITLFPDLIQHYLSEALLVKAQANKLLQFDIYNLRNYSLKKYKSVDDRAFGGGDGMVLEIDPLVRCLEDVLSNHLTHEKKQIIYMSPQGSPLNQDKIIELASYDHLILVSGRYAGVDQRFISSFVDQEVSIGDYVLSGGELPSLVLTEAISRQIPGVLGDHQSSQKDSFSSELNGLLEAPQFTRPQLWKDFGVPDVLLSGNHQHIAEWQNAVSILTTLSKRPDVLVHKKINWSVVQNYYNSISEKDRRLLQIENLEAILSRIQKESSRE